MTTANKINLYAAALTWLVILCAGSDCQAQKRAAAPSKSTADSIALERKKFRAPDKGWCGIVNAGVIPYFGSERLSIEGSVRITGAYRVSRFFTLGLMSGLDGGKGHLLLPVAAAARVNFARKRIIPFFDANLGYALLVQKGGPFHGINFGGALGCKYWFNKKIAISLKAGISGNAIFGKVNENNLAIFKGIPVHIGVEF
jgi:hypothetical protein